MVLKIGLQMLLYPTINKTLTANLLRKPDVDEEELGQVPEHCAVKTAGPRPVEELLLPEPEREGGQVLVSHLPDYRLLLSADLKCPVFVQRRIPRSSHLTPEM